MTVPERNAIRKKLELSGAAEVKKRVEAGAHAKNKLLIVKQLLAEQVTTLGVPDGEKSPTLVDKYITRLKNYPAIAIVVVGTMAIGGVAQFTDALSKLAVMYRSVRSPGTLPAIPGDSGWILVGDLDQTTASYVRGPFYKTEKNSYPTSYVVPRKGDVLRLLVERNIIISRYKTSGLALQFMPPWQLNTLSDADYTGIKLPKDSIVEVRDVSLGSLPGQPVVVWVRVAQPPK